MFQFIIFIFAKFCLLACANIVKHLHKELMDEIQERYKEYNPNPGYEPYWPQGAWVFVDLDAKFNRTTTKMQLVCGEECNYLHKRIKDVCGRQINYGDSQCHQPGCIIDIMSNIFLNFKTYCEFLNHQCRESKPERHWILVHVGRCVEPQDSFLKPVRYGGPMASRVGKYFSRISQVFWNATLPSPL